MFVEVSVVLSVVLSNLDESDPLSEFLLFEKVRSRSTLKRREKSEKNEKFELKSSTLG